MDSLKVICLNGFPLSGKDTFVKCCRAAVDGNKLIVRQCSTVSQAKAALQLLGWDGLETNKTPEVRSALHTLKVMSDELFNGPLLYVYNQVQRIQLMDAPKGILFVDSREPEELERLKKVFNATVIRISRPSGEINNLVNGADDKVLNYEYDYVIDNDGDIVDLVMSAETFLKEIGLGDTLTCK